MNYDMLRHSNSIHLKGNKRGFSLEQDIQTWERNMKEQTLITSRQTWSSAHYNNGSNDNKNINSWSPWCSNNSMTAFICKFQEKYQLMHPNTRESLIKWGMVTSSSKSAQTLTWYSPSIRMFWVLRSWCKRGGVILWRKFTPKAIS